MLKRAIAWLNVCANAGCRAKPVRTRLLCSGAYIGEERYCSPDCLHAGLVRHFSELLHKPKSVQNKRQHRIPLGLELVSRGYIDGQTLQAALQRQKQQPDVRLGQILMSMGAVSEEQITTAVAAQWSVPVFRLDPCRVPEAAQLVPFALMERYKMLPVHFGKQQNRLHLAFAQAVDYSVLYSIEQMLGVTTEACMADESVLLNLIGLTSNQERPAEYVLNNLSSAELASMIAGYALRLRSERIRTSSCHGQIWVSATAKDKVATHFMFSSRFPREALPEASRY
jgi:hypothetical protein